MGLRHVGAALAVGACALSACSASSGHRPATSAAATSASSTAPITSAAVSTPTPTVTPSTARPSTTHRNSPIRTPTHSSSHKAAPRSTHSSVSVQGSRLPLSFSTGSATQVITAVASSTGSTVGTLQAWRRSGSAWVRVGPSVVAHFGGAGLTTHPSESNSATPIGSFTLTQAFGALGDPGTALPYTHTNPHDWWISDTSSSQYNTMQYCSSGCTFAHAPNEHLYYETPYYNHAVVIDYNTRNAPGGVRVGAGSAFFLHVTDGGATAGCVSIESTQLVRIMQWLTPGAHPRILIGVG